MTPDDAQLLLTRGFQVEEVCSWFGVPLSLVQHTEKSTSWGTGIGQLTLGFLIFTMQPWLTLWEKAISQQLILRPDRFFAEFLVDGLLRGDSNARIAFYRGMVNILSMTPNEVRERENLNPFDDPEMDKPVRPLNIQQGQEGQENRDRESNALAREAVIPDRYFEKALRLALEASRRMVQVEIKAIRTLAKKHADNPGEWAEAAQGFYAAHKAELAEELMIPWEVASVYCEGQIGGLLKDGLKATEKWEKDRPAQLAAVILSGGTS
jgi:hypothetical protein